MGDGSGFEFTEARFVGASRRALVDDLFNRYIKVVETQSPQWVSLEAPSGWGKTRLLHEFYRRLAAEQQPDGEYWPRSILEGVRPEDRASLETPEGRRKRIYPEWVRPAKDSVPAWFWLGIGCALRAGTPFQALANDLTQFETHQRGLTERWKRDASMVERFGKTLRSDKAKDVAETTLGEAVSFAGLAVPGLGVLRMFAKWAFRSWRHSKDDPEDHAGAIDASDRSRPDLVDELAPALAQLALKIVPLIVVVEDIHLADNSLVEVLRRLLVGKGPILIVTTAWPAVLDEPGRAPNALVGADPTRTMRLRVGDGEELSDLEPEALLRLAAALLPQASSDQLTPLTDRYTNPLAMELVAAMPLLRRRIQAGDDIAPVLARLPSGVRGLYEAMWAQLPEPTQSALLLAVLSTPITISSEVGGGDARWDAELLRKGALSSEEFRGWLVDPVSNLDEVGADHAWVRFVDDWLRRFHDPIQHEIAAALAYESFDPETDLRGYYKAIGDHVDLSKEADPSRRLQNARLLLALQAEGFCTRTRNWLSAVLTVCRWLSRQPHLDSWTELLTIAEPAIADDDATIDVILAGEIRSINATALSEVGRVDEALDQFQSLLDDLTRFLGAEHSRTLATRNEVASRLGEVGRVDEAIDQFRALLDDQTRILGAEHLGTLATRNNLASQLGKAGRVDEAIDQFGALLEYLPRILGEEHPGTLATRNNLASQLGQAGRVDEAIFRFRTLVDDLTGTLGTEHPEVLATRNNLAYWLGEAGRVDEAIHQFRALLGSRTSLLGAEHPDTLATRLHLATQLGKAGQIDEAIDRFRALLDDQTRILGATHPQTLVTRNNLAYWMGEAGQIDEAIDRFRALLEDRTRILGTEHPDTLATRINLASRLSDAGHVSEAIHQFQTLLGDLTRILGPEHPRTFATRNNLAFGLGEAGRVDEAIDQFRTLLDDQTRILGPEHPEVLATRNNLAYWLGEAGRLDEAIDQFRTLLDDHTRILGDSHPDTLSTRNNLASLLGEAGRLDEAIDQLRTLVDDRTRILGTWHPQTLNARNNLAGWLGEAGMVDAALEEFEAVFDDRVRILGPKHPDTIVTRDNLASLRRRAGRG